VGEGYEGALLLTRLTSALVADLADAPRPPIDPVAAVSDLSSRLDRYEGLVIEAGLSGDLQPLREDLSLTLRACEAADRRLRELDPDDSGPSAALIAFDRAWIDPEGLPGRPWYRNELAASDRDSGYGAVVLPAMAEAIRDRDQAALDRAIADYRTMLARVRLAAGRIAPEAD
ncbi:MAG: transferrin receptor-like dimerization domain-containing protein, partial [Planctomycetota bacterium]|nr:transferrin receptor-like dimerization domain-containing protein [Planctomycetota bacterium]